MTTVVVDTSVVVKWFHADGEHEVVESRALLAAHRDEVLTAYVLELGIYELANVLLRSLGWSAADTADQLEDLSVICGPALTPAPAWHRMAAALAEEHRLSFYDATFVAAARATESTLVSADKQLLSAGLAESPATCARRLGLLDG
jgi:predicted nucleic acid-binding protein